MSGFDVYVFAFQRPDGQWGAIADRDGRLIVTGYEVLATAFRVVIGRRGLAVTALKRNPLQIAELVMSYHVAAADIVPHVEFLENAECEDAEDALWRTIEMAHAIPADTIGDWNAAHPERVMT